MKLYRYADIGYEIVEYVYNSKHISLKENKIILSEGGARFSLLNIGIFVSAVGAFYCFKKLNAQEIEQLKKWFKWSKKK